MGKRLAPDKAVSKQCVQWCWRVNELGQQSSGIHCEMSVAVGFPAFGWEFEINLDHLLAAGVCVSLLIKLVPPVISHTPAYHED